MTCLTSQKHPSSSRFPLAVRKFGQVDGKSSFQSFLCMRNAHERYQARIINGRSRAHRFVSLLHQTTQSSAFTLRFYSQLFSCLLLCLLLAIIGVTLAYVLSYTAYLGEAAVYHWLVWTLTMFFVCILIFEPLLLLWTEVIWCSIIESWAQNWGFGVSALSATAKYKLAAASVDAGFVGELRKLGADRVQRWWRAVLDTKRAIQDQTAAAIKIQAMRKKMIHQKKYVKERKWCMVVDVKDCGDLAEVQLTELMSPFLRLQCDTGNPTVMQTKVLWDLGQFVRIDESFFVDIKESNGLYVSVWSKGLKGEEFVGRGYFEFSEFKNGEKGQEGQGHNLKLALHDIQHGEIPRPTNKSLGYVNLRIRFLDPLKESKEISDNGEAPDWMLPKHQVMFQMGQMGGQLKMSNFAAGGTKHFVKGGIFASGKVTPKTTPVTTALEWRPASGRGNGMPGPNPAGFQGGPPGMPHPGGVPFNTPPAGLPPGGVPLVPPRMPPPGTGPPPGVGPPPGNGLGAPSGRPPAGFAPLGRPPAGGPPPGGPLPGGPPPGGPPPGGGPPQAGVSLRAGATGLSLNSRPPRETGEPAIPGAMPD